MVKMNDEFEIIRIEAVMAGISLKGLKKTTKPEDSRSPVKGLLSVGTCHGGWYKGYDVRQPVPLLPSEYSTFTKAIQQSRP
jgi:hypothetical protein